MKTKPDIAAAVNAVLDLYDSPDATRSIKEWCKGVLADLIGTSDVNKARKYLDGLLGIE